ncbi:kinase-like protein, partial [Auricularia subglabra TFB-10046 SS5]
VDALRHIHVRGLIHRDIKPDNILLNADSLHHIYLIDYGLAARPAALRLPNELQSEKDPENMGSVLGTLSYASLNAHKGITLSYRDDLESLAYTLLSLLRRNLPWSNYTRYFGTDLGRIRQVYRQKQAYDGSRLAFGFPDVFGKFLDDARSLSDSMFPFHAAWIRAF